MTRDTAELGFAPPDRLLITCGPAALGLLLAWVLPMVARWALDLHFWLPFRPAFVVVGAVDEPWELAVQAGILVVLGLLGTATLYENLTTVTVSRFEARIGPAGLPRGEVTAVYLDGDDLVVLDRESRQAARCVPRARRRVLAATFPEFGYPWRDADPYAGLYHRWTPSSDALPPAADAVLSARAVAVRKKAAKEARELRATLEKLGYSVRDEGGEQLWRPLVHS
ncbi:YqeB family protein [Actinoplanes awajinensis]|uniref:DUF308 domain-containing protein n=1 Tax=Actinoplanes awajinensis subsp. mycoplanecinus TaxID=135947 RepID=A0A101JPG7_9ACTN|nr:hypothetical protein [Actinoplanes awajinensis]KUL30021.1 hypothetical protein ADL15_25985 [Actinoplanes awajinensis subsp. mycoplanecinus]